MKHKTEKGHELDIDRYRVRQEPYYAEVSGEVGLFTIASKNRMPVMLKGPTGCGKTRFVEHMAWKLGRPLITVACHEDLTASDLVGRYLLKGNETVWVDGPLTVGVKHGALGYLDAWWVIGPFDNERGAGERRAFPPERGFDPTATCDGKKRPVQWRPLPVPAPPAGRIDLGAMVQPRQQVLCYVATALIALSMFAKALLALADVDTFTELIPNELVVMSLRSRLSELPDPLLNPMAIEKLIVLPLVKA